MKTDSNTERSKNVITRIVYELVPDKSRTGLFRFWIIASFVWIVSSVAFMNPWKDAQIVYRYFRYDLVERADDRRFEAEKELERSEIRFFGSDYWKGLMNNPNALRDPNNMDAYRYNAAVRNLELLERSLRGARMEEREHYQQLKRKISIVILPPIGVFFLALAYFWVLKGFAGGTGKVD